MNKKLAYLLVIPGFFVGLMAGAIFLGTPIMIALNLLFGVNIFAPIMDKVLTFGAWGGAISGVVISFSAAYCLNNE